MNYLNTLPAHLPVGVGTTYRLDKYNRPAATVFVSGMNSYLAVVANPLEEERIHESIMDFELNPHGLTIARQNMVTKSQIRNWAGRDMALLVFDIWEHINYVRKIANDPRLMIDMIPVVSMRMRKSPPVVIETNPTVLAGYDSVWGDNPLIDAVALWKLYNAATNDKERNQKGSRRR